MASYLEHYAANLPRTIYLYVTDHCNSNCVYCVFRMSNAKLKRSEMSLSFIQDVWRQSFILKGGIRLDIPAPKIVVQGGEFTIHPEAVEIVRFFHDEGLTAILLTNSVDLDLVRPVAEWVDDITISYDGPAHDVSRGVKGNKTSIHAMLAELTGSGKHLTLQMTLGPWNLNLEAIEHTLDLAARTGCQLRFNVASSQGLLGQGSYVIKEAQLIDVAHFLEGANSSCLSIENVRYVTKVAENSLPHHCFSTSFYSTIMANGDVLLCQGLDYTEAITGNLHQSGFDAIWIMAQSKRAQYSHCRACTLSCQLMGDFNLIEEVKELHG